MIYVWRSEDNSKDLVPSILWGLGIELRLVGLAVYLPLYVEPSSLPMFLNKNMTGCIKSY